MSIAQALKGALMLDFAGALRAVAHGREAPHAAQVGERAFDQAHADRASFFVGVAGGEGLLNAAQADADLGHHALGIGFEDAGTVTPRQKFGVTRHVGHEAKHFFWRVPDQNGLVDILHTMQRL